MEDWKEDLEGRKEDSKVREEDLDGRLEANLGDLQHLILVTIQIV